MDIYELIKEYGDLFYVIVAVWTFFEGETVVLFAGAAASKGVIDLPTLILCAWMGSFLGDQLYFAVGRRWGVRLLKKYPRLEGKVNGALHLLKRYSTGFILSFRFIYGVRNVASFAMGMSGISWIRFAILNFIAAGVWAMSFAGIGYLAGAALESMLGDLAFEVTMGMLAAFMLVSLILWIRSRLRSAAQPT